MPEPTSAPPHRPSSRAIRLTFAYEGDRVTLVDQQQVEVIVPSSDPMHEDDRRASFWLDLKDAQDRTLFRRVLHQPIRVDAEVFSPGAERNIARQPVPVPRGLFVALVPDAEQGLQVTLSTAKPLAGTAHAAAKQPEVKEIARFTLRK